MLKTNHDEADADADDEESLEAEDQE